MSFFSIWFVLLVFVTFILSYTFSPKYRHVILLLASLGFYGLLSYTALLILLFVILSTYFAAIFMQRKPKPILYLCLVANILLLILCKYWVLWDDEWIIPIGISFFTLQALGYVIDIYRGNAVVERNILKYSLYVSFFPCILSGPIERSSNLLPQINNPKPFDYNSVKSGLLTILWGYFLKLLIANRLAQIVDVTYGDISASTGLSLLIATVLYGIQLYADFSGYSYIAIGVGRILGFDIIANFRQPYFSLSVRDFWNRWHISFSSWLKDYVYIPLGGSRHGTFHTYLNLFLTFLISGLWHGTGYQFVIWGILHGMYQIVARLLMQHVPNAAPKVNKNCFSYHLFQYVRTFILIDFAWLFFRSDSLTQAVAILKKILFDSQIGLTVSEKLYLSGFQIERYYLLLFEILILLIVDILHEKKISITSILSRQNTPFRWGIYILLSFSILIGIIHDYGLSINTFIYANF